MVAISAGMVKELRERTGQAMMDCKKALTESDGDMEKAVDILRKKGMAVMEKRVGRETKEGRVIGKIADDGKAAAMVMLCCETDFTSKSDEFGKVAVALGDAVLAANAAPADADAAAQLPAEGRTVGDLVNDIVSKTGEKTTIGDCERFELSGSGLLFCYVHFNSKIGTLIQIDAENDQAAKSDAVKTLAADLAMHVTAVNPRAVCREEMDADEVARERDVAVSQVQGKPENIIDKIVDGKMNKWFQQSVLIEQPFVKDDSKTVTQLVEEVGKEAGGNLTVKRFARMQIG